MVIAGVGIAVTLDLSDTLNRLPSRPLVEPEFARTANFRGIDSACRPLVFVRGELRIALPNNTIGRKSDGHSGADAQLTL